MRLVDSLGEELRRMEMNLCPVCGYRLVRDMTRDERRVFSVECYRCRTYSITLDAAESLEQNPLTPIQKGAAAGWLRENPDQLIQAPEVQRFRGRPPVSVGEQATKLLQHLARLHPQPGEEFWASLDDPVSQSVAWAYGHQHMKYLIEDYLADAAGHLALTDRIVTNDALRAKITPTGWKHLEGLRALNPESPQAFVAMHFHASTLELRSRGLVPGIEAAGYRPLVIDEKRHNNLILDEILAGIRQSRFVVADFTGQRGGVYFEAGFAQGLGLQVIRTCCNEELGELHFDVNHYRFLKWQAGELEAFAEELQHHIEVTIGRGPVPRGRA